MIKFTVLACPYGGNNRGRDAHDQYFSKETNFLIDLGNGEELPPNVPLYFIHGAMSGIVKEQIGYANNPRLSELGLWYDAYADENPLGEYLQAQSRKGMLYTSSGVIPASMIIEDGHIKQWQVAEISLVDIKIVNPANLFAIATQTENMENMQQFMAIISQLYGLLSNWQAEQLKPENQMDDNTDVKCEGCKGKCAETMKAQLSTVHTSTNTLVTAIKTSLKQITDEAVKADSLSWLDKMVTEKKVAKTEYEVVKSQLIAAGSNDIALQAVKAIIEVRKPATTDLFIAPMQAGKSQEEIDAQTMAIMRRAAGLK